MNKYQKKEAKLAKYISESLLSKPFLHNYRNARKFVRLMYIKKKCFECFKWMERFE